MRSERHSLAPVGGNLHAVCHFRHIPAQPVAARVSRLDRGVAHATVSVADMPRPDVSHLPGLIRTLTLTGRVGAFPRAPGFFVFSEENQDIRRSFAHSARCSAISLKAMAIVPTSKVSNRTEQTEDATCSVPKPSLRRHFSQGFLPAAPHPANRRFSALGPVRARRPFLTATLSQARLSGLLATSSTVDNTPIAADRRGRFGARRIGTASSRHHARAGSGGRVLSCPTFSQTKDHPCSRRS